VKWTYLHSSRRQQHFRSCKNISDVRPHIIFHFLLIPPPRLVLTAGTGPSNGKPLASTSSTKVSQSEDHSAASCSKKRSLHGTLSQANGRWLHQARSDCDLLHPGRNQPLLLHFEILQPKGGRELKKAFTAVKSSLKAGASGKRRDPVTARASRQ